VVAVVKGVVVDVAEKSSGAETFVGLLVQADGEVGDEDVGFFDRESGEGGECLAGTVVENLDQLVGLKARTNQ
jgi:hypothetical protein